LLRTARERRGLDIGALAARLKVSPRKIHALEADRYDDLPDPAFTRALAMSVCRLVGADAAPVLALLPQVAVAPSGLEHVTTGLSAPFDGRHPDDRALRAWSPRLHHLAVAAALLLLAAAGLWLLTADRPVTTAGPEAAVLAEPAPSASSAASSASGISGLPVGADSAPSAGASAVMAGAASALPMASAVVAPVAPPSAGSITVTAPSWVEVRDGAGQVRWSRLLAAGETVSLEGPLPLRLVIGNARAAKLVFAGRMVELAPWTRDNVARLDLQ
jgi:cytoskeleton protein RodZ